MKDKKVLIVLPISLNSKGVIFPEFSISFV